MEGMEHSYADVLFARPRWNIVMRTYFFHVSLMSLFVNLFCLYVILLLNNHSLYLAIGFRLKA